MRRSITNLMAMKGQTPLVMVTAYDATTARLVDEAVDCILVGDSLGMVVQGRDSTIPVTLEEIIYHTRMVARGTQHAFLIADLPFLTYQVSTEDALRSAGRCLKEARAQAVKVEGGAPVLPQVKAMTAVGIPVVGHIGVTPQSINALGGYGKRGRNEGEAARLLEDALALEEAGASMIVLENLVHAVAKTITERLRILTIGIGAGADCDGQVQVLHDLMGLIPEFTPRHAHRYFEGGQGIQDAIRKYADDVRGGQFMSK